MMSDLLCLDDVSLSFGGVKALDGVKFSVQRGEVLGLIGPNGAGKTTAMSVISGLYRPGGGQVVFEGKTISGMPAYRIARMGIGRTFQVVQPFANLSVLDNVAVGSLFSGSRRTTRKQAIEQAGIALERVRLSSRADLLPTQLTLSDRKRLEVARALSTHPRLLLLDEVMAGLNHSEIADLIELVREIQRSGVAVIIIEHVMPVILAVCDRVAVLQFGKVIALDVPQVVTRDSEVISAYLGSRFAERQKQRAAVTGE